MNPVHRKAFRKFLQFPVAMGGLLFLPANTLHYWEGWVFCANFLVCSLASTVYLAIHDPKLLERRMNAGPLAEKEPAQKIIMTFAMVSFAGLLIVPGLDHRFGWSDVPIEAVILGNLLIAVGFLAVFFVMKENTFASSNIELAADHRVISTGPYALVRHPMYTGALGIMVGMPLSLGSWWGLVAVIPSFCGIAMRLLNEERFLTQKLPGYSEYKRRIRYRLLPGIW